MRKIYFKRILNKVLYEEKEVATILLGIIVFLGMLIGLAVVVFAAASDHAYLLALGFGIVGLSVIGLRVALAREDK